MISDGETERAIADNVDQDDVKVDRVSVAYIGKNGREALHLLVSLSRSVREQAPQLTPTAYRSY